MRTPRSTRTSKNARKHVLRASLVSQSIARTTTGHLSLLGFEHSIPKTSVEIGISPSSLRRNSFYFSTLSEIHLMWKSNILLLMTNLIFTQ